MSVGGNDGEWSLILGGVEVGGGPDAVGCLTVPPDGMGLPEIRTEDVTYPQRDGVVHYGDWYLPRIITAAGVRVCNDDCTGCPSARMKVRQISDAWRRKCDDVELVIVTDCGLPGECDNQITNGSFTDGLTGWDTSGTLNTETFLTPPASLRINIPAESLSASFTWSPQIPVAPGQQWTAAYWAYAVTTNTQEASISAVFYDADDNIIGALEAPFVQASLAEWSENSITGLVPEDSEYALIVVSLAGFSEFQEQVLFDDLSFCRTDAGAREFSGPFGVIGRPRVGSTRWERSNVGCAEMLLRFDAVDHRMYILDADGTPGSGVETYVLTPDRTTLCRTYPRCYPLCYTEDISEPGEGPVDMLVAGNVCAQPIITLTGQLTAPRIENLTTGQSITYGGTIAADDLPVIINTANGTATQGGISRTNLLTGTTRFQLPVGVSTLRLVSFSDSDDGTAEVSFRPAVDSA